MTDQLPSFIEKFLAVNDAKCSRHCDKKARFVPIRQSDTNLVGTYICPQNYVSRVVYFADNPDPKWFQEFLVGQFGKAEVRSRDIRKATRHGWELGGEAEKEISNVSKTRSICQYYWTSYPQTDREKENGIFVCAKEDGGCGKFYSKLKSDESKLCPSCSRA
jgi:hypothetical protein